LHVIDSTDAYSEDLYRNNACAGMEMSQLYCGGCRTLLMYTRGATSVRCSCCHTVNLVPGTTFNVSRHLIEGWWFNIDFGGLHVN